MSFMHGLAIDVLNGKKLLDEKKCEITNTTQR